MGHAPTGTRPVGTGFPRSEAATSSFAAEGKQFQRSTVDGPRARPGETAPHRVDGVADLAAPITMLRFDRIAHRHPR